MKKTYIDTIANKVLKCIITISAILLYGQSALAQNIDPTVEVQRDFDGRMTNIHKSHLKSTIPDSLSNFNLSFNYSIFNKPYKDLYEFSPLPSADLQGKVEEKMPVFLAKAGLGFPLTPLAEIYYQPKLKGGNTLQLNAAYNGFYGNLNTLSIDPKRLEIVKNKEFESHSSNTDFGAGATYGYHWKNGELSLDLGYNANACSYYGFYTAPSTAVSEKFMTDSCSHKWQQLGARFNIRSVDARVSKVRFHYNLNINYLNTADKLPQNSVIYDVSKGNKMNENYIRAYGEFGPTIGKYNMITIGFNSENALYSGIQDYKYGIYEIIPQYTFEKGRFKFKGGVKISGRYKSKEQTDIYHNTIFAVGEISFELARRNLWLYGIVDGGNCINSYSMLLGENRWIAQDTDLRAGSVPFLVKGGFRGQIRNKFSYNLYARYAVHNGLVQYVGGLPSAAAYPVNKDSRLNAIYSNHREFTLGGELKWESKSVSAGTCVEYSNYTRGKKSTLKDGLRAIGYAPFKWDLHATYNYRERIWIGITSNFRGATPTWFVAYPDDEIECSPFLNLGVNAKYAISRNLSVYIYGENLLDSQIQHYPQYLEKGISFGAGILVKF